MCLLNKLAKLQGLVKRSKGVDNLISQSGERFVVFGVGIHHIANEGNDAGLARKLVPRIVYPSHPRQTFTVPQEALQIHKCHRHYRQVMHLRLDNQQYH